MDGIEIEAENRVDEKNYVDDLESGNHTYGEKIDYVAVSPDGSIVATFNLYSSKDSATLICMNCVKIQKININLDKNISVSKEVDEKQFSIVHEVSIKRTTFGENDPVMTDEHEYQSCDLEPWNNNEKIIHVFNYGNLKL
uniref:Uncharacterized protein n=1 Tax=Rhizophagus irregularis (strain DAOM 181602 / DAOM 197198 / MUCL 43194) TaxID=747089 RepID=U9UHJ6_RHIID